MNKPKIAVHKFSSCDGCQLAFLNLGSALLDLANLVEVAHFAEAGYLDEHQKVDICFIEGSISTEQEKIRIQQIRANSKFLITIGACATSGGIQALKNMHDGNAWLSAIYARPEYIDSLATVSPVAEHVPVDFELWGCPVSSEQILTTVRAILSGITPTDSPEKVCMECKRHQVVCRLVVDGTPCLGPVTRAGCGALCPQFERGCYACYGPAQDTNTTALGQRLEGLGLLPEDTARRFQLFHNNAPVFRNAAKRVTGKSGQ